MIDNSIKDKAKKYFLDDRAVIRLEEHLQATSLLAAELAATVGVDQRLAEETGYWHDVTRLWSDEQSVAFCNNNFVSADADEFKAGTKLLHGPIAAYLWGKEFGNDLTSQNAIRNHTLGCDAPDTLEMIISLADAGAYDRTYPEAIIVRQMAMQSLADAYRYLFKQKIAYVRSRGDFPHPRSLVAANAIQRSGNAS